MQPASLLKMSLFHKCFFKHVASKNQLRGFYISQTLVENGLKSLRYLSLRYLFLLKLETQVALQNLQRTYNSRHLSTVLAHYDEFIVIK